MLSVPVTNANTLLNLFLVRNNEPFIFLCSISYSPNQLKNWQIQQTQANSSDAHLDRVARFHRSSAGKFEYLNLLMYTQLTIRSIWKNYGLKVGWVNIFNTFNLNFYDFAHSFRFLIVIDWYVFPKPWFRRIFQATTSIFTLEEKRIHSDCHFYNHSIY